MNLLVWYSWSSIHEFDINSILRQCWEWYLQATDWSTLVTMVHSSTPPHTCSTVVRGLQKDELLCRQVQQSYLGWDCLSVTRMKSHHHCCSLLIILSSCFTAASHFSVILFHNSWFWSLGCCSHKPEKSVKFLPNFHDYLPLKRNWLVLDVVPFLSIFHFWFVEADGPC